MAGKRFVQTIFSFSNPVAPTSKYQNPEIYHVRCPTFSISGRVRAGGEGMIVDLPYTPAGAPPIVLRTRTGPNGTYQFPDLAPGVYRPVAIREGFIFTTPAPVNLQTANATNVDISSPGACAYGVTSLPDFTAAARAGYSRHLDYFDLRLGGGERG